jgi:hypothetical protein
LGERFTHEDIPAVLLHVVDQPPRKPQDVDIIYHLWSEDEDLEVMPDVEVWQGLFTD